MQQQPPQTVWDRQMAIYRYDMQKWARRFGLSTWALWVIMAGVLLGGCGLWSTATLNYMAQTARAVSAVATQTADASTSSTPADLPTVPATQPIAPAQPTATLAPMPTATPSSVVLQVSGNGDKTTETFTVRGTWRIDWSCSGGGLGISIYDARTNDYATNIDGVSYTCPANGGSDASTFHSGGTFYLSIIAATDYIITVTDLPN